MTNLYRSLARRGGTRGIPLSQLTSLSQLFDGAMSTPFAMPQATLGQTAEEIGADFQGYVQDAYKSNGVVFACMLVRQLLFSEARFMYQQLRQGRPGDLFGSTDLRILEEPWPGGTTSNLLSRAIQDADLAGNWYAHRRGNRIYRLRPDWVTIVLGSQSEPDSEYPGIADDAEVLGYLYHPGGRGSGHKPVSYLREQVAHFAPIPDPCASYRGMSWLTPVVREIMGDQAAMTHKLKFFENGAVPSMIVSLDPGIKQQEFDQWIENFEEGNGTGIADAYRTLYLGGGAKVEVVGKDLKQLDFKVVQGANETRIAAAAGVPPIIVGLSEGLDAATYSNYGQARRRFADGTMRPLWRDISGSLANIVATQDGARLWVDARDISFLQEDVKDEAEIQQADAISIKQLIEAGFDPASVVEAITANDLHRLKHSGLVSVQLQEPGAQSDPAKPVPALPAP